MGPGDMEKGCNGRNPHGMSHLSMQMGMISWSPLDMDIVGEVGIQDRNTNVSRHVWDAFWVNIVGTGCKDGSCLLSQYLAIPGRNKYTAVNKNVRIQGKTFEAGNISVIFPRY